jgi:hypothetical protein
MFLYPLFKKNLSESYQHKKGLINIACVGNENYLYKLLC